MKYIIIGATGLIGKTFIDHLLKNKEEVIAVSRKPLDIKNDNFTNVVAENILNINFEDLPKSDVIISALGTTIKKAKSKENFKAIDYSLVSEFLNHLPKNMTVILISALGANKKSYIFYNKIKGLLEEKIQSLGFERLIILRPSLLIGAREEKRAIEALSQALFKNLNEIVPNKFKKFTPHAAELVVDCALNILKEEQRNYPIEFKDIK
jgi:uncharacterized protein YbjT (DUF2867 family)